MGQRPSLTFFMIAAKQVQENHAGDKLVKMKDVLSALGCLRGTVAQGGQTGSPQGNTCTPPVPFLHQPAL